MADSKRETALQKLAALWTAACAPAQVTRNEPEPSRIPAGGFVSILDGDPGEPETLLGPTTIYSWQHEAEVMVFVQGANSAQRATDLDIILQAAADAMKADQTLGGAVDMVAPYAPEIEDRYIDGAQTVKAARVVVVLEYDSTSPLG